MNPVIIIPARMTSTRLPGKPLADINGKPMIVHVWERAVASGVGPVVIACDDARIEAAIADAGGRAIMTRNDHVSGSDRIFEALQKIDPTAQYDVVINLQGDEPTIEPDLIRAVLEPLKDSAVDIATLACEIHDEEKLRDPSVVKPALSFANHKPRIATAASFSRTAPSGNGTAYHHIGIYAYRCDALARFVSLSPSLREKSERLEQLRAIDAGMRIDVAIVDAAPLGVDTPEHLEQARKLLS